jgi:hypothetical protein
VAPDSRDKDPDSDPDPKIEKNVQVKKITYM